MKKKKPLKVCLKFSIEEDDPMKTKICEKFSELMRLLEDNDVIKTELTKGAK